MQDIRRSLMIFHLKENFSKDDLQKAYKRLVKKYHPDFNQENQDWSHKKMIEINLAYELCKEHLVGRGNPTPKDSPEPPRRGPDHFYEDVFHAAAAREKQKQAKSKSPAGPLSPQLLESIHNTTFIFNRITGRYYEYGLENRYLRYEGNRKFRYRQCLKEFREILRSLEELHQFCRNDYDTHIQAVYRNFIVSYYKYIILDEQDIPRHPSLNAYWYKMEEYLNACLIDYLASFLAKRFGRVSWQVSLSQSVNHITFLQKKFPRLNKNKTFRIIIDLAENYAAIREEEGKSKILFFRRS